MKRDSESASRPAGAAAWQSARRIQTIAVVVGAVIVGRRLELPAWFTGLLIVGVVALAIWVDSRAARELAGIESLTDLGREIDGSSGRRRVDLTWYEYAIARSVVGGSYADEPPADFMLDVRTLKSRMTGASRYIVRDSALILAGVIVSMGALMLTQTWLKGEVVDVQLLEILAAISAFIVVVVIITMLVMSKTRHARHGRLVEDASEFTSEQRWQNLVELASQELQAGATHS